MFLKGLLYEFIGTKTNWKIFNQITTSRSGFVVRKKLEEEKTVNKSSALQLLK